MGLPSRPQSIDLIDLIDFREWRLPIKRIPVNRTDDLWRWTAAELAHGIRTRAISSREAVASCLGRIAEANARLNAVVEVLTEEAEEAATLADQRIGSGDLLGPLHGVPVLTKINSDQSGHATTNGIAALKGTLSPVDSPQIAALRAAGAVIVGRTNTPAFSYRWFTSCEAHGRTLNPWDESRTPGGSSGGAAAAVASGMVPIAQGNDIGGSIRYPAYACGVMGIRPTSGRVAGTASPPGVDAPLSVQYMSVQGPLARTVSDLRLAFAAMTVPSDVDPIYAPVPLVGPALERPIRVGLLRHTGAAESDPAVVSALETAARCLTDVGYVVEEIELPLLDEAFRLWWLLAMEEFRSVMPLVAQSGDPSIIRAAGYYYEIVAQMWGKAPTLENYINGYARRNTLIRDLQQRMSRYPLILLPISSELAFEQDADLKGVDRCRELIQAQASMMAIALLGFPAIAVPTGLHRGLPVGVQLLGRRFREDTLFDAAEVIESRRGLLTPIDGR